ncbi:MAG: hypothetical protein ACOZCO_03275 [Bacteroidota bacterium]
MHRLFYFFGQHDFFKKLFILAAELKGITYQQKDDAKAKKNDQF